MILDSSSHDRDVVVYYQGCFLAWSTKHDYRWGHVLPVLSCVSVDRSFERVHVLSLFELLMLWVGWGFGGEMVFHSA